MKGRCSYGCMLCALAVVLAVLGVISILHNTKYPMFF